MLHEEKKFENTKFIPTRLTYGSIGPPVMAAGGVELWDTVTCKSGTVTDSTGKVLCTAQHQKANWEEK